MSEDRNKLAKSLPFDQYSRQLFVSRLIDDAIRPLSKTKKLHIIDLGGHKGKTATFQSNDIVTILDVFDESYKNYIKGDATKMDFKDDSFDIACSFDVFEHIPRAKRKAFITESLRVSRLGVFLALPVDVDGRVSSGERLLNEFHKSLFAKDHRWLKEHIDYKIPTEDEIDVLVKAAGAEKVSVPSNQIGDWQLMQMLIFMSASNPELVGVAQNMSTWYNQNIQDIDANVDVGYRRIFFLSKDKRTTERVQASIAKFAKKNVKDEYETVHRKTFARFADALSAINQKYTSQRKNFEAMTADRDRQVERVNELRNELANVSERVAELQGELNGVYGSRSWRVTAPLRKAGLVRRKIKNNR